MTEQDNSWTAALERGPLDVDKWTAERLESELEERLPALLQSFGADNTMEGWRDVALQLALTYHPAFKIKRKHKLAVSGRPIEANRWMLRQMVLSRRRKLKAQAKAKGASDRVDAEAARQVHAELKAIETVARSRQRGKRYKRDH